jgi:hypothetical protein
MRYQYTWTDLVDDNRLSMVRQERFSPEWTIVPIAAADQFGWSVEGLVIDLFQQYRGISECHARSPERESITLQSFMIAAVCIDLFEALRDRLLIASSYVIASQDLSIVYYCIEDGDMGILVVHKSVQWPKQFPTIDEHWRGMEALVASRESPLTPLWRSVMTLRRD